MVNNVEKRKKLNDAVNFSFHICAHINTCITTPNYLAFPTERSWNRNTSQNIFILFFTKHNNLIIKL